MNIRGLLAARLSDRSLSLIAIHRLKYRLNLYSLTPLHETTARNKWCTGEDSNLRSA